MRSILKALGLTIWGSIAIGLLVVSVFVGYEAAMRHRASNDKQVDESTPIDRADYRQVGASDGIASSAANTLSPALVSTRTPEATRKLLSETLHDSKYDLAIAYGQQLVDSSSANPGDLTIIAQSYFSLGDCKNARLWAQRAQDAFQAAGTVPDGSLRSVVVCCGPGLESYELAIASIERGLAKGGVVHLAEAYVYLGLSKQAVGDFEGACYAFGKLKDVPGISPRVLQLWTLYAEMQLKSENLKCSKTDPVNHDSK